MQASLTETTRPMNGLAKLLLGALVFAAPAIAPARDQSMLWAVQGRSNTVYLLGSIHALKPDDTRLPAAAEQAFGDSERLVMEIDMDDEASDPLAMAAEMQQAALLPQGQTLRSVLGSDYSSINDRTRKVGLDLALLDGFAPWFVAINVMDLQLAQHGLSSDYGVEQTLAARAVASHKPIEGFETAAQQFGMLATMPLPMQKRFLQMTLEDSANFDREVDDLVHAWKTGDTTALARMLADESREFPDLYRRLTVDRNRAWAVRIEDLLDDRDDYLVVVGAMHLVGPDSVVDLLRKRGHLITQQ